MKEILLIIGALLFCYSVPFVISNWGMYYTYRNYKKEAIISTIIMITAITILILGIEK